MLTGAVYIRVSTEDQTEFSPDAQLKAIKNYAKQNDIVITKEFIYADEGISGRSAEKRPAFQKMIATAKTKPHSPFDVILVHKFDRFARSREDSIVYKSLLRKECNVRVISITESIENDKFSLILEAILEAMAEYYSINLSEEVLKGMTEKAEQGGVQTIPSLGYDVVNNQYVINEDEAKVVRLIFEKITSGEIGIMPLTHYLNDMGFKTKRGNPFAYKSLIYILNNPVYIGKIRWSPEKFKPGYAYYENPNAIIRDGGHESIVSEETFLKAKAILKKNKEVYGGRSKQTTQLKTWLKGLVRCSCCGKTLVQTNKHFLQCNGYAKGQCKTSCHVSYILLEKLILEELKKTYTEQLQINVIPKVTDNNLTVEYDSLNMLINNLQLKEKRIKQAYEDGIDTIEEYKENKHRLQSEREAAIKQLSQLKETLLNPNEQPIYNKIQSLYEFLTDESVDLKNKHLSASYLIDNIVYSKKEKTLTMTYK